MPSTAPFKRISTMRDASNSTQDFTPAELLGCETPEGYIVLFDEHYLPVEPANEFMLSHCYQPAKYGRWKKTQAAYADDLAVWWAFLYRKNVTWDAVGRPEIKDFVAELTTSGVSHKTRRKLADATVRRRVGTVLTFYDWAVDEKKLITLEKHFGYANRRALYNERHRARVQNSKQPAKLTKAGAYDNYLPEKTDAADTIRPIPAHRLNDILNALGPRFMGDAPGLSRRNRLIAEAALVTGMRIDEVCSMDVTDVQNHAERLTAENRHELFSIRVNRTKGRSFRLVLMSGHMIERLDEYIQGERHDVIKAALDQGKFGGWLKPRPPSALFLNGATANRRDIGEPISPDTPYRAFAKALCAAGLTIPMWRYEIDPETGAPVRDENNKAVTVASGNVPEHSFHDLRHTYAVNFYAAALKAGRPDALKQLQALLGHRNLATTANVYLRHVKLGEALIADLQDQLYKSLLVRGR